jgi:hypothetical protein
MVHAREATRQLNMFVASPHFKDVCGAYASAELLAWLANSFFVHSDSLYFCYRKVCIVIFRYAQPKHLPKFSPYFLFET